MATVQLKTRDAGDAGTPAAAARRQPEASPGALVRPLAPLGSAEGPPWRHSLGDTNANGRDVVISQPIYLTVPTALLQHCPPAAIYSGTSLLQQLLTYRIVAIQI